MSSIAILSDIHANLPALEAVLADVERSGTAELLFLGDLVGYGASPAECLERIRKTGGNCIMGNHDAAIREVRRRGCTFRDPDWESCSYQPGLAYAAKHMNPIQASWLASLPYSINIPGAIAAHGSLDEPEAFNYITDIESAEPTLELLKSGKTKIGFFGHTHVQAVFTHDTDLLEWINDSTVRIPPGVACAVTVGAVGQPRHDPDMHAGWVLWDHEAGIVQFRKTAYDRLKAAADIRTAGLPLESSLALLTTREIRDLLS